MAKPPDDARQLPLSDDEPTGKADPALGPAGHRARLRDRFLTAGDAALADHELLELILFAGIPRRDTKPIARKLLQEFGGLAGVLTASPASLGTRGGLGDGAIAHLRAVHVAARRLAWQEVAKKPVLSSWQAVLDYLHVSLAHEGRERFHILFLNSANELMVDEAQQEGTVDRTAAYPREVVRRALELGASALILVHNHPSGDPEPSAEDIVLTRSIAEAAKALGIRLHDHVIMARDGHASFKALGLL